MSEGPLGLPVVALGEEPDPGALDRDALARAHQFLEELSRGLFPDGVGLELLTWADRLTSGSGRDLGERTIEERLKSAEARFVTLVQQIPAVTFMAVLGEGENEVYVSPHIEQMLGYRQDEWLADPFLWYTRLHPDDRMLWNEEFARGCRTGGPFRAECRFLARDGRVVWVHGEARLVRDALGRPQFLQGVAFDITESKRAQEVLLDNAVRDAKLAEQFAIARRVQTSILPRDPALPGLELSALTLPADEIGGDYYDVRPTHDGGWITIGDVSGHGLDAGIVMLMVQSATMALTTARPSISADELLILLNEVIYENVACRLASNEYVTLSVMRYHRAGRVTFAGAHQDVLVRRAATGKVERVRTPGPWIGIRRDIRSATVEGSLHLRRGDVMALYTDGLIEAMNASGEQFDLPRLVRVLEGAGDRSVAEIRDALLEPVRRWTSQQEDDLTLVVSRYTGI